MNKLFLLMLIVIWPVMSFGQSTVTIKVFFLNTNNDPDLEDCRAVKPATRTIPKTSGVAKAALEELFKGVTAEEESKGFTSFSPDETSGALKSINIKQGAAYVNFNKVVYEKLGSATSSCGGGFFSSIEATLKQFPTIKKVFFAIDGDVAGFYDWVQVGDCPKELKNCDNRNFK
ncbi:MAG: GerMN domain-containing protein [Pyrinomonadaceae bacterium]